ncbi:MAG: tRNA (guanosine(46)-N7)-methyltransferase TrmB [Bacteroidales bacterium]|nr:tRNA (guanosine(46)-N7)-methyltransferase TrmB [Bacteroidales bacterium]
MPKKKLQRFEEIKTFPNVLQPVFREVFQKDHPLKGNWKNTYFENENPIILELGCGKGEYTIGLARTNPGSSYIGVDIKGARIWKGAQTALLEGISNVVFIRTRIELVSSFFGESEVDEIWLTFPDPQPKKVRKRLSSSRFLKCYQRFLKNNGRIHLKTDSDMLYRYTLALAVRNHFKILHRTEDLYHSGIQNDILQIRTFYEQQFLDKNLKIKYLCFELPIGTAIEEQVAYEGQMLF